MYIPLRSRMLSFGEETWTHYLNSGCENASVNSWTDPISPCEERTCAVNAWCSPQWRKLVAHEIVSTCLILLWKRPSVWIREDTRRAEVLWSNTKCITSRKICQVGYNVRALRFCHSLNNDKEKNCGTHF